MKRLMTTAYAMAILGGAILALGAAPAGVDLKAMKAVATDYDKYAHSGAEGTWDKGDAIPTAKKEDADAWTVEGGTVTADKDGLRLEANADVGCNATLSKKTFKGPIGIKYEAMTPEGENPCDLSVRFGPAGDKNLVTFAFGGYANNDNFFYLGKTRKVVGRDPLITPGQWYKVEVFVSPDTITAKIDGKEVGSEKLPLHLGDDIEHDLTLYVWNSKGVFKNIQMLKYTPPKADARTWEQAMGQTTKEQMKAMAVKLGGLLGNDDFATRESAEEILFLIRPFSDDVVKEALKNTDPEVKIRAERLAAKMGIPTEGDKDAPAKADPQADPNADLPGGQNIAPGIRIMRGHMQGGNN